MRGKIDTYNFRRYGAPAKSTGGAAVLLRSFDNLFAYEFSFPFQGISRVKDAIRLQYRPLLGDGINNVEFIPFFTQISKKSSSGCVFLLNREETSGADDTLSGVSPKDAVWPAPLAFAGEVGPDGLLIWREKDRITSVWIKNWTPAFYRTSSSEAAAPDDEERTALEYIRSMGGEAEKILVVDSRDVSDSDLQSCGLKTIKACPYYAGLDLSGTGANMQERRERILESLSKVSRAALFSGVIFLLAAAAVFMRQSSLEALAEGHSASLYETAFKERSMQPLVSAAAKLRNTGEAGRDDSIVSYLRDVSSVWGQLGDDPGITIETLKYGSQNADIMGTARDNAPIQKLRSGLENLGYSIRVDNIQSIPGGGMRFSMNVTGGGAR
jgi:hypothetical protein